jgi:hypothetical protein
MFTAMTASANAQTDQQKINDRYIICVNATTFGQDGAKEREEWSEYCLKTAIFDVFMDNCEALHTSWLQWGTFG